MNYRDTILTYLFARAAFYDLLALHRLIRSFLFGFCGMIAVLVFISHNHLWHTIWHRPVWTMSDEQVRVAAHEHPEYADYREYVRQQSHYAE